MRKTRVVGLNKAYKKQLMDAMLKPIVSKQTELLIEYAKGEIIRIGDYIQTNAESENHMDRTGHLLNSLCWGVSYQGKLVGSGFYRQETTKRGRRTNTWKDGSPVYTNKSNLHEWSDPTVSDMFPVNGRKFAERYLKSYGNNGARGWRVFFAILAPYWGYWEKGFRFKLNPQSENSGYGFMQFAVMTHFYDEVRRDLKPARTRFRVSVPKYDMVKLERRATR